MDLRSFGENIYSGYLLLEAAKIKQRNMENMVIKLDEYNPSKEKCKTQKASTLLNAKEFYKRRKVIFIAFENGVFPLPKKYPSGMSD